MNELRSFVLTVATAGILVAVIDTLAPEGKRGRGVKFVSSLFMIPVSYTHLYRISGKCTCVLLCLWYTKSSPRLAWGFV